MAIDYLISKAELLNIIKDTFRPNNFYEPRYFAEAVERATPKMAVLVPREIVGMVYHCWYQPCKYGNTFPNGIDCDGCQGECDIKPAVIEIPRVDINFIKAHFNHFGFDDKDNGMGRYFLKKEKAEEALRRYTEKTI